MKLNKKEIHTILTRLIICIILTHFILFAGWDIKEFDYTVVPYWTFWLVINMGFFYMERTVKKRKK
jgi:hypothetical protein